MSDVQADRLERMNRFVKRMNEVNRDLSSPYVRPKDAATLILVDRSGRVPKVLLGKRHQRHKFMPGKFVFPGGRVDPVDRRMPVARPLDPHDEAHLMRRLQRASPDKARAFALAAIRETFEETGLLLGVRSEQTAKVPRGPWGAFAAAKILPDLGALHFIGRAITPPGRPRRFDARFFTMDASAIADRVEGVTGPDAELVELVWMALAEAKQLDMPAVTGVMMEELDARIADGFGHDLPVPFYSMPRGRFQRELLL
jgi:8-oxo-dGTP pyrophosphatase MutT (NUDIX family)